MQRHQTLKVLHDAAAPHWPAPDATPMRVTRDSPAVLALMDFAHEQPLLVGPDCHAPTAAVVFESSGATDLLVRSSSGEILGILGRSDMHEGKVLKIVHDLKKRYAEIEASELMTPVAQIGRITMRDACRASINDVLQTMKEEGSRFLLVVRSEQQPDSVCGLFSTDRFNRSLHGDVAHGWPAPSFADLEKQLVPLDLH